MLFNLNEKSVLLLFFVLHILIFSIILLFRSFRYQHPGDKWLSLFLFLAAMYIVPFMLGYAGWYSGGTPRKLLLFIPFQQLLLFPPVFYLYIRCMLDPSFRIEKQALLHFLPAALYFLYILILFVADNFLDLGEKFYADGRDKDFDSWYQFAGVISMIAYLCISLFYYMRYRRRIFGSVSYADTIAYNWTRIFIIVFLLFLLLRVLLFLFNPEWGAFGRKFWYYAVFGSLAYCLSIGGLINSVRIAGMLKLIYNIPLAETPVFTDPIKELQVDDGHAGGPDQPSFEDIESWKYKIRQEMEEHALYENPELTVAQLAGRLGLHPKKTSQVINAGFGVNFNDFVNTYRVNAVIRQLDRGDDSLQTIFSLALSAGFNSKTTFNRVFKKQTGVTPKEWAARKAKK